MSAPSEAAVSTAANRHIPQQSLGSGLLHYLPRGNLLDDDAWQKRHQIVWSLLLLHLPGLTLFGLVTGHSPETVGLTVTPVLACLALERLLRQRRPRSFFTTAGIVYCSAALVGLSHGSIEAHFHFFVIIGFIALYQDWVPFLWEIVFTVLSHGLGSGFQSNLVFNHHAAVQHPWIWSLTHGVAVLAACVGVVLFWRTTEDEQQKSIMLTKQLGEAEVGRFTSQLLVNLARRNQGMLYRQLDIINQLEEKEEDPDALAGLFRLDHLATRIRRNAESFLVLSGEEPARVWSNPVPLFDVVRAAIAETEDLNRVGFMVDERLAVQGHVVTDLTHLLAELVENAARFSEPGSRVTIRSTPEVRSPGAWVLTVEDRGIGMPSEDLAVTNEILAKPRSIDAATSQRLGLHVVARLAHRHSIKVALCSTSVVGITAVILLPPAVFAQAPRHVADLIPDPLGWATSGGHSGLMALSGRPDRRGSRALAIDEAPAESGGRLAGNRARALASEAGPEPDGVPAPPVTDTSRPTVEPSQAAAGPSWSAAEPSGTTAEPGGTAAALSRPTAEPSRAVVGRSRPGAEPARPATELNRPATGPSWPTAERGAGTGATSATIRLNRRTPQANLAPELRGGPSVTTRPVAEVQPADAVRARDAMSRYQASRQAALAECTTGRGDPP